MLYEEGHLKRLGVEEYTATKDTKERWLDGWATSLIDEYDVDCLVDALVGQLAKNDDGQPWSLRELDEAQGINWVQWLLARFNQMPGWIEEKICQFQTKQMDIEELATVLIPDIKDLLKLLSHTASRYMGTKGWPEILDQIKETDASQRFFKEHLDTIIGHVRRFPVTV